MVSQRSHGRQKMTVQDPGRHKGEASVTAASPEKTSHMSSTAWLSIFFLLQGTPEACRHNGLPPALPYVTILSNGSQTEVENP